MSAQDWRARLIKAAQAVVASEQPCYDSDEGKALDFVDVDTEAMHTLRAVLSEREGDDD